MVSMKKVIFGFFLIMMAGCSNAQILSPVLWNYSATKTGDKTYELHITAIIQPGWHLYSQHQPDDAIINPTTIVFNKNPLVILDGKSKEIGKMELYRDKKLGISANQYAGKLDIVQKIKLKTNVKTNVVGSVEFQTCDDKKCLPPATVNFSIPIK